MKPSDYRHPSDRIKDIKGVVECVRLAIGGLETLDTIPSEGEIWGMFMILDHINDRLDLLNESLELNAMEASNGKG